MQTIPTKFTIWDSSIIPKLTVHLIFLFFFFLSSPVSTALDISPGSSLSSSNPNLFWSSPNNTFSLRFLPINSTSYTLAITYGSIPTWKPAGKSTVVGPGATFRLLSGGDLRLISSSGETLWSSNTSGLGVSHANLDNSGNFSLSNRTGTVWSSFDHPYDTVVPSQRFDVEKVLTSGIYSFSLNRNGNLTLRWNNSVVYYSSGLNNSVNVNLSNPYLELQSDGVLSLYDSNLSKPMTLAYTNDYGDGDLFRFLKLDNDGNLRIYSAQNQGNGTTTPTWTALSDQCLVFGYCGNMGICSYNDTSPTCGCPSENFVSMDPNESRMGCRLKKELKDCSGTTAMLELDHTRFLTHPPETNPEVFFEGISACRGNCLSGPCLASTSFGDGSGQCYMADGFVSGYHSAALLSTSFVKVCQPIEPNPPPSFEQGGTDHEKLKGWIIALIVLGTLVGLALVEGSLWWWCCQKNPNYGSLSVQYTLLDYASGAPVQFSYKQLEQATSGFKEKLGEGGFGSVYKGVLANKSLAAVKQLQGLEQGEKQFRMEVATISSTHHLNLVRLIGFCSQGRHRLLVYEFMKNGSLDSFLFSLEKESRKQLNWQVRFNIALGTAKGITYLHEECRDCIVHCDIKPENILIDDNLNAKVSDFGLAKLVNPTGDKNRSLASIRGTRGYLAPEWLANLPITSKSDVYSFGMVLLEIVSGKRNFQVSEETNMKKFSTWAYEEFDKGNMTSILDKRLIEVDMDQVMRAIRVSFWCIQEQPNQRPMMGKVVQMLEGITEIEKPPVPKASTEILISDSNLLTSSISIIANSSGPNHSSSVSSSAARDPSTPSRIDVDNPTSCLIQTQSSPMNN